MFRSVLFVPVTVPHFVAKAATVGADVACLDLEDAVPWQEKGEARAAAPGAIESISKACSVWVRVNGLATGLLDDDLKSIVRPGLGAVMLPKAESVEDVQGLDAALDRLERERGIDLGTIGIVPLIETAAGVLRAEVICGASKRVVAAAFGSEDFRLQLGVPASTEALRYPRAHLAIVCAAAGVAAIDTVDPQFHDEERNEREMLAVRDLGFAGKLCIHPSQVAIANRVFAPGEAEIAEARRIVETFEREGLAKGRAAIAIEGKMVDTPHYERARRLLEWADRVERDEYRR